MFAGFIIELQERLLFFKIVSNLLLGNIFLSRSISQPPVGWQNALDPPILLAKVAVY